MGMKSYTGISDPDVLWSDPGNSESRTPKKKKILTVKRKIKATQNGIHDS